VFVLVRRPRVFRKGTFDIEPLTRNHVVQMARHGPIGVFLDDEVEVALLVCVADGRVRADCGLLLLGSFVLRQNRRSNMQPTDLVCLWQLKPQLLDIVVHNLNLL